MGVLGVLIIAALSAAGVAAAAANEGGVIHVGGKVLCQDCTQGWNEWIHGNPIQGSKVSVTCLDERHRVVHYASDLTDESGQFDIVVSNYIIGKKLNPKLCSVRLVSSPDPACNILTDFAGGRSGVRLHGPNLMYRDLVKYVVGSFYFTTPMCDQPDDDNDDDDTIKGKHY